MNITVFTQDFAVEAYARNERRTGEIKTLVEMCQEFGATTDETIQKLMTKFGLSRDDAEGYEREFSTYSPLCPSAPAADG